MRRTVTIGIVALVLAGCGGSAVASPSPVATPTPEPSIAHAPMPATLTPAQNVTAHVTESATALMSIQGDKAIAAWITSEMAWLNQRDTLPILRAYRSAIMDGLIDIAFLTPEKNLDSTALKIIAAARAVPGVVLP